MTRKRLWILIVLLVAGHAVGNIFWLSLNGNRCVGSAFHARHFMRATEFFDAFEDERPLRETLSIIHKDSKHPAPLHSLSAAALMRMHGKNIPLVTWLLNLFYFALASFFLAKLALDAGRSESEAAWAALILSLYPGVYGLSRLYGAFDFQVMGMVPLSAWALLRADRFRNKRFSLVLGGAVGTGMLLKDTFAGYFFVPLLLGIVETLRSSPDRRQKINLATSACLAAILALPYYAHPVIARKEATELYREPSPWIPFLIEKWDAYTIELSENLLTPLFFVLFAVFLWRFVRREPAGALKSTLLGWIFFPWAVLFLMLHHKAPDYFVPILPAAALISSIGIHALAARRGRMLKIACLSVGLVQYGVFSFGFGNEKFRSVRLDLPGGGEFVYFNFDSGLVFHSDYRFNFDAYLSTAESIRRMDRWRARKTRVMVLPTPGTREYFTFYHLLDWKFQLDYSYTGGLGGMFDFEFLEKPADKVLFPKPEDWNVDDYVDFFLKKSIESDALEAEAGRFVADSVRLKKRLTAYLEGFPVRERVGFDGENEFWLLSKASE